MGGAAFTNLSLLYHLFCFDVFEFTFLLSFICYLGVQVGFIILFFHHLPAVIGISLGEGMEKWSGKKVEATNTGGI